MDTYDVVIIGGGAGAKLIWGSVGHRSVAVVERALVGGACPFLACVPSKAMLGSAAVWHAAGTPQWSPLFGEPKAARDAYDEAVTRRDRIVHHRDDGANAMGLEATGAHLLRGTARIIGPGVVSVDDVEVGYRDLVLNTGSHAVIPDIPGLDTATVWTSDEALSTTEYPRSAVIVGGGAVGCELAFLFATFGTSVTVVQRGHSLMPGEEPETGAALHDLLVARGVKVHLGTTVARVDGHRLHLGSGATVDGEVMILAAGRRPTTHELGLDRLGITVTDRGAVAVDDRCRAIGDPHLWAIGDVTDIATFTHTAHYQGRVVAANLSGRDVAADYRTIPRAVYTDPVFASVGHTVASARANGIEPAVTRTPMRSTVRANIDDATDGWLTLLADPATGLVLGASASGGAAAEWISEVSLMIRAEIPVSVAADVVHPFPTYGEILETPLWELSAQMASPETVTKEIR